MPDPNASENASLLTALEQYLEPKIETLADAKVEGAAVAEASVLVHPKGHVVTDLKPFLDKYRKAPERRKGTATFTDLDSFIAHVVRFKNTDSVVFASDAADEPSLTCVYDYHPAGPDPTAARYGEHKAAYEFPLSDEWTEWMGRDGAEHAMPQQAFAEFIENRIADIADPASAGPVALKFADLLGASFAPPAQLLELSRGLAIRVEQKLVNKPRLSSGETVLQYEEVHTGEGGGPLKVPGAFLVEVPVFARGGPYQLPVRLRYRVGANGAVTWFYEVYRSDETFHHALGEAVERVKTETGLTVLLGSPEK